MLSEALSEQTDVVVARLPYRVPRIQVDDAGPGTDPGCPKHHLARRFEELPEVGNRLSGGSSVLSLGALNLTFISKREMVLSTLSLEVARSAHSSKVSETPAIGYELEPIESFV